MVIHREREVWWRGLATVGEISLVVALLGCLAVLVLAGLFEKIFLRRLERLRGDLASLQERPGRGARVPVHGTGDDIDGVAGQVNSTLGALEEAQANLADAQRIARLGFLRLDLGTMRAHVSAEHVETADLRRLAQPMEIAFSEYLERFVHPDDRERMRGWADYARSRGDQAVERDVEYRTIGHNGEVRHIAATCRRRQEEPGTLFLVAQDITERRRMEDELLRGSLYDTLTGLPNRNLVLDRVSGALGRSGGELVTLLVLDIDRFGAVNASLGRDIGDGVLLGLAVRLVGALPPGTTVGRMSHHEFGVLMERSHEEIERIAESLRAVARTPLPLGGRELVLTGSVGVASASAGECLAEELVSRAESAAYSASVHGGDSVTYFDEERSRQARERVEMEIDLAKAIGSELELHYQPIVRLDSGKLAGFEALVRWRHPTRGLIPPAVFIPIAERSGLIHDLGIWVLEEAMRREAGWQARLGADAPFMSINLSVRQFHHDDLADRILATVARTGVDPNGVKLEITESALSEDPHRVAELLEHLCSTGLRFSLDDFGTGYSSLGYLSRFPVQTLKVDKSFVDELGQDEKKTRITSAIVTLAHSLDMDVVAEGIETDIQRERLLALGCEFGQGYLFSTPLPGPLAEEYLVR
jgi:diguanylate cyclase (GGDEF)-like protein